MLSSVQLEMINNINGKFKDKQVHGFYQYDKDLCYVEIISKDPKVKNYDSLYTYQPSTDTLKVFNPIRNIKRFKEINSKIFRF